MAGSQRLRVVSNWKRELALAETEDRLAGRRHGGLGSGRRRPDTAGRRELGRTGQLPLAGGYPRPARAGLGLEGERQDRQDAGDRSALRDLPARGAGHLHRPGPHPDTGVPRRWCGQPLAGRRQPARPLAPRDAGELPQRDAALDHADRPGRALQSGGQKLVLQGGELPAARGALLPVTPVQRRRGRGGDPRVRHPNPPLLRRRPSSVRGQAGGRVPRPRALRRRAGLERDRARPDRLRLSLRRQGVVRRRARRGTHGVPGHADRRAGASHRAPRSRR